jgi:hypothetical protein
VYLVDSGGEPHAVPALAGAQVGEVYQLNLKTRKWAKAICQGACPARQRMAWCGAAAKDDSNSLVLLGGMRDGMTLHDMHVLSLSGSYELGWTRPDCGHKLRVRCPPLRVTGRRCVCICQDRAPELLRCVVAAGQVGEGSTICHIKTNDTKDTQYLVAYGGYSGSYSKKVFIMLCGPTMKSALAPPRGLVVSAPVAPVVVSSGTAMSPPKSTTNESYEGACAPPSPHPARKPSWYVARGPLRF